MATESEYNAAIPIIPTTTTTATPTMTTTATITRQVFYKRARLLKSTFRSQSPDKDGDGDDDDDYDKFENAIAD